MDKPERTINFPSRLLLACLALHCSVTFAQQLAVPSGANSAGFKIYSQSTTSKPVIDYQQHIQMLSSIDDRQSLQVFGDGRVLAHYPVYMKKAGDYEMQLDNAELAQLIRALSRNGILDFDDNAAKQKITARKNALRQKGLYYEVSDAVESVVDIRLDEYQKNSASKKLTNFRKQFRWKNIEHDAARYRHDREITRANDGVNALKALMRDPRLKDRAQP